MPLLTRATAVAAVEACDPPVSAMSQLLQALNSGNDFSAFVRGMRKQFRQLV